MESQLITPQSTLGEIFRSYPFVRRVLIQKYQIGSNPHIYFSLSETLEEVFRKSNQISRLKEAIELMTRIAKIEKDIQITPKELEKRLKQGENWKLLDVRESFEREIAVIPDSLHLTSDLVSEILEHWDKKTKMVFYCHSGIRSMEAAYFFISHDFIFIKNLQGGITQWAREVDPSIPLY